MRPLELFHTHTHRMTTVFPRIEPRASISFREAIAPGSKRGRLINGAGFYLLLVSDLANNVT